MAGHRDGKGWISSTTPAYPFTYTANEHPNRLLYVVGIGLKLRLRCDSNSAAAYWAAAPTSSYNPWEAKGCREPGLDRSG